MKNLRSPPECVNQNLHFCKIPSRSTCTLKFKEHQCRVGSASFSCVRGQRVNIFSVRQTITVASIPLCCCSMKVAIDNMVTRGQSCVPIKLDFPKLYFPDLACRPQSADGVYSGVESQILEVLVFNLDIAEVSVEWCYNLHSLAVCVLPTLGFDGPFEFCQPAGCKMILTCTSLLNIFAKICWPLEFPHL